MRIQTAMKTFLLTIKLLKSSNTTGCSEMLDFVLLPMSNLLQYYFMTLNQGLFYFSELEVLSAITTIITKISFIFFSTIWNRFLLFFVRKVQKLSSGNLTSFERRSLFLPSLSISNALLSFSGVLQAVEKQHSLKLLLHLQKLIFFHFLE